MLSIQKHKCGLLYSAFLGLGLLLATPALGGTIDADASNAAIFVYQRIGDDSVPQANISVDKFKAHIKELTAGGYNVVPLGKVIDALKAGEELPQNTVALTFDGAFMSTFNNSVPLMEEAKLPYTIFYASDMIDRAMPTRMSWDQIKTLRRNSRVSIGILPSAYMHMAGRTPEQNAAIINKAIGRYKEQFGEDPAFFAYPYGEYSAALRQLVGKYSFKAAFGEQSGVAHPKADFTALPRFIMTDAYGDLDRFRLTANALPLPVTDVMPEDMLITENPPLIGFTVAPELTDISRLSCFVSGVGKVDLVKPGGNRVEIRLQEQLVDRRTRLNCTLPDDVVIPGQSETWRWYGTQLITPYEGEGDEPEEEDEPGSVEEE